MTSKAMSRLTAFAAIGALFASPAIAATTRSAEALPLLAANVGSVPYSTGAENTWRCIPITDEVLDLEEDNVQVDQAGRVVLSPKGVPYRCRPPVGNFKVGRGGGFPFELLLGIVGLGGLIAAFAGGGGNDSNG